MLFDLKKKNLFNIFLFLNKLLCLNSSRRTKQDVIVDDKTENFKITFYQKHTNKTVLFLSPLSYYYHFS